jgi:hypothetical protein
LSGLYGFGNPGGFDPTGNANEPLGGGGAGEDGYKTGPESGNGGDGLYCVTPDMGPYGHEYRFSDVFGLDHGEIINDDAWFAGGGASGYVHTKKYGGKGGGGDGRTVNSVSAGTAGTGGGGAGKSTSKYTRGQSGGSGIVLIAYDNPRVNQPDFKYQTVNTEIDIWPGRDSGLKGKLTLYYRRIVLENFFKHRQVVFRRWTENNRLTSDQLLDLYNEEFGTQFIPEDFETKTFSPSSNPQRLNVLDTSLTYLGHLEFIWNPGERELDQVLETDAIDGYVWDPRFVSEPVDTKPYLTFTGWGFDYGRHYENQIEDLPSGAVVDKHTPVLNALVDHYNRVHDMQLDTSIPHTEPNGLKGLTVMRYVLPNDTVDEANALRFSRVYAIRANPDSWFTGTVLFHYDPK